MSAKHGYWNRRYRELLAREQRQCLMLAKAREYQIAFQWLATKDHQPPSTNANYPAIHG